MMNLVGYTNPMAVRAGEGLSLHVSCAAERFSASIVRLRHGDTNPAGPGFIAYPVESSIEGEYDGAWHDIAVGSCAVVEDAGALLNTPAATVAVWICPTAPGVRLQSVLARDVEGFCVALGADSRPVLKIGSSEFAGPDALLKDQWYLLVARFDRRTGSAELHTRPRDAWPDCTRPGTVRGSFDDAGEWTGPLLMAARQAGAGIADHFNGKLDSPAIFPQWLPDDALEALFTARPGLEPMAEWDFGADQAAIVVPDRSGAFPARLKGMPTRAVTGHRWTAVATRPEESPAHYSAIHFHDDDCEDAGWPVALTLAPGDDWPSGIYAFRLGTAAGDEDYVPFFVLPQRDGPHAPVAFLAPTFSYLAYGNVHYSRMPHNPAIEAILATLELPQAQDRYVRQQKLNSCYDRHTDGGGVAYVSRLLPQVHIRPKVNYHLKPYPHQFNADLHLVDWLHARGFRHDVLTDEALHHEGVDLLAPYRVILTGTHPEYWSGAMLDALQAYLHAGGRVMYLGGNGFYWVTSVHPDAPHVLEIRKSGGTQTWDAVPGERHHSTTGEHGGLWRHRGRAPQKLLGVGMAAEGFDGNAAYRRTEESHDESLAFMFEGIAGEVFGDTPSLVQGRGAAGFEIDRIDFSLGSPPNTICVARSFDLSDSYLLATEDILASMLTDIGPGNPLVRSDIAYVRYPNGGAVFSVGSISYCGCLSHDGYDNDISRLTENVLRRFSDAGSGAG